MAIANDTKYGLAGYVQGGDIERVRSVAAKIRAGRIYLNGAPPDRSVPFGAANNPAMDVNTGYSNSKSISR